MTVEDGTGLSNSNSYVSLVDAAAYHTLHGNTAWAAAATDALREAALIRATFAIDSMAWSRWKGQRHVYTQALCWPRDDAYDDLGYPISGIPAALKNAVCEAALLELAEANVLTKKAETGIKRVKVGSVEKEYAIASASGANAYPAVVGPLQPLITPSTGLKVVRV